MAEIVRTLRIEVKSDELATAKKEVLLLEKELKELNKTVKANGTATQEQLKRMSQLDVNLKAAKNKYHDLQSEVLKTNDAFKKNSGFVEGIKKAMGDVGGTILKVSGAIAGAAALWEGFKKIMNSTAASADAFAFSMSGLKGALDGALKSIASGDWKNLWKNIKQNAGASYDLAKALDEVEERELAVNAQIASNRDRLADLLIQTKNKNLSDKQQKAAAEEYLKIAKQNADLEFSVAQQRTKAYTTFVQQQTLITNSTLEWYIKHKALNDEVSRGSEFLRIEGIIMGKLNDTDYKLFLENIAKAREEKAKFKEENKKVINTYNSLVDAINKEGEAQIKTNEEVTAKKIQNAEKVQAVYDKIAKQVEDNNKLVEQMTQDHLDAMAKMTQDAEDISDAAFQKTIEDYNKMAEEKYNILNQSGQVSLARQRQDEIDQIEDNALLTYEQRQKAKFEINQRYNALIYTSIADLLTAASGLAKKDSTAQKALSIAAATINTYVGVTKALATMPPPLSFITAATTLATGLVAVKNITSVEGFADGGLVQRKNIPTQRNGDNVLATVKTGEVVLNQKHQAMLGGSKTFRKIGIPGFAGGGRVGANIPAKYERNVMQNNTIKVIQVQRDFEKAQKEFKVASSQGDF